jgi:VIT1/CCC1 family predicted Fe2+/Mn2+ transporter
MSMAAGEYVSVHSQADTEQKMTQIAPAITFAPPACAASPPA